MTKICTKCKQELPLEAFYKKKSGKFGVDGKCKTCYIAKVAEYRATPEGQAKKKAWDQSEKAKASAKEYWQSPAGKEVIKRARAKVKLNQKEVPPIPEYKVCTICKQDLPIESFSIRKTGVPRSECKKCGAIIAANYRKTEHGKTVTDAYIERRDKDALREASRKYEETGKGKVRMERFKRTSKYKAILKRSSNKRRQKPGEVLCDAMRNSISRSLKGSKNGRHWETLVGYTLEELRAHLEKQFIGGMSWDNYGIGEGQWSVDHIMPRTFFKFETDTDSEFLRCWSLKNLQPMWHIENIKKRDKILKPTQIPLI